MDFGMMQVSKNVMTKQIIKAIESLKTTDETDYDINDYIFDDGQGYLLLTNFKIYQTRGIYSIHDFSNKFVFPCVILNECNKLFSLFIYYLFFNNGKIWNPQGIKLYFFHFAMTL